MPLVIKRFTLLIAGLVLVACGPGLVGCKKADQKPKIDPHSPEAVLRQIVDLGTRLREGVRTKDYAYVADRAYVLQGVAKALHAKLDAERQQRLGRLFNDVARVGEELDHAAGRKHEAATVASMDKLEALLTELQAQFDPGAKK